MVLFLIFLGLFVMFIAGAAGWTSWRSSGRRWTWTRKDGDDERSITNGDSGTLAHGALEAQLTLAKVPQMSADLEALGSIVDLRRQVEVLRERLAASERDRDVARDLARIATERVDELEANLAASAVEISEMVASHAAAVAQIRRIEQDRALVLDRLAASERAQATARADALADALMHVREPGPTRESIQWLLDAARVGASGVLVIEQPVIRDAVKGKTSK